ncbi:MAG: Gfo/Idh/MocA family oxidoreductase [Treponema sp.]|jgi:predicted dehydrogenase|nr:Gfo/Idh/MocA family oxidoreductase [Treponema sp.]
MNKLKVGIVGAGNIAQSAHLPAYKKLADRAEVVAIADTNLERAQEAAKTFGIPKAYASVEELLSGSDVDYIDICVWNGFHAAVAVAVARAGKAILCEKPMSDSLAHSLEIEAEVKKAGVPFMMAMVSRFGAETMMLHDMEKAGELGDVYYGKTGYVRRRGTPIGWFTDVSKSGGGPVIDIGVHCIDACWFLMGRPKPVRVSAAISRAIGNFRTKGVSRWTALDAGSGVFDTEDSASAIIHFENGASMLAEASWALNTKQSRYTQVCGTKGGAVLEPLTIFSENSLGYLTDNQPAVPKVNPFEEEIAHFIDCLNTGKKPISPIEDGIAVQKMLSGIYESAELGKEVTL